MVTRQWFEEKLGAATKYFGKKPEVIIIDRVTATEMLVIGQDGDITKSFQESFVDTPAVFVLAKTKFVKFGCPSTDNVLLEFSPE